ncbi:hypothetical protein AGMMS49965_25980 [Bacteroidia bacterium]|nr:hypothetical protein AGMMS49965_25980 [Bacteroidia bacterium]
MLLVAGKKIDFTNIFTPLAPSPIILSISVGKSIGKISYIKANVGTIRKNDGSRPALYRANPTDNINPAAGHVTKEKKFPAKSPTGKNMTHEISEITKGNTMSIAVRFLALFTTMMSVISPPKKARKP